MRGLNSIVINVSTKQQPKVIWECTHYQNMRGSYLIVYKTTQKSSLSNKSTQNQYMKESCIVVTSVTTKPHTSMLLGFINNQYTRISNLIVNNESTKQQKGSSESAHSIETLGD